MQIHSVGIDLGKTTFHLVALSAAGKVLLRKKFTQKQLITFTANMQISLIGMEACSGAHFLGRILQEQGHDVKLIPAQFVKPFVKSNKNDFLDAEAIAEAVDRQNMRFVPIKTDDQLDLQAMHRVRDRLVARRTSVINQLRAFLLERGRVFAKTPFKPKQAMPEILENADANLTPRMRNLSACCGANGGVGGFSVPLWRNFSGVVEAGGAYDRTYSKLQHRTEPLLRDGRDSHASPKPNQVPAVRPRLVRRSACFDSYFPDRVGKLPTSYDTSFVLTVGGGLDIAVSKHIWIRAVQADYFYSERNLQGNRQNQVRLGAGIVFRGGGK